MSRRGALRIHPPRLEVPPPDAQRIAVLLGECASRISDLLDDVPEAAGLPERRRRTRLINRIRIELASTGLLVGMSQVFDPPAQRRVTR